MLKLSIDGATILIFIQNIEPNIVNISESDVIFKKKEFYWNKIVL